jgi:hypothetical protein
MSQQALDNLVVLTSREESRGRTLAYIYIDTNGGSLERLVNEDLIKLGLVRTTSLAHTYRREFEPARGDRREARRAVGLLPQRRPVARPPLASCRPAA